MTEDEKAQEEAADEAAAPQRTDDAPEARDAAAGDPAGRPPTEEELRAAYEAELKALRVEEVVAQTVVSLLNLGARKAGLLPGSEDEADAGQVALAVESVRRLLPLIEPALGENAGQIKDALSQLQVAYARLAGEEAPQDGGEGGPDDGEGPPSGEGPESGPGGDQPPPGGDSGLWVPGR
ncbi:MAG: hypothetical protein FGM34_06725 [Solirubrobacteraceae bacterium]|nr:hypothetical protein [Solirubrobacteraceae bacterium]